MRYDKFGRSDFYHNVFGKELLKKENMTEPNLISTTKIEQKSLHKEITSWNITLTILKKK